MCPINADDRVEKLTRVVDQLAEQVGRLQTEYQRLLQTATTPPKRHMSNTECWKCHLHGMLLPIEPYSKPTTATRKLEPSDPND